MRGYTLKLAKIFEDIVHGVDQSVDSAANVVLMMDKLKSNTDFVTILHQLTMPSDKYKAIVEFANILGIPYERLIDFIQQQENQKQSTNRQPNG